MIRTFDLQLFADGAGDASVATPPATPPATPAATPPATPPTAPDATPPTAPDASITTPPATPPATPAATPPATPPAALDLKFNVPEGFDQPSEAFVELAKQYNLTQEQAQGFVDFYAKTIIPQFQQTLDQQNAEWSAKTVSEFGNEGIEVAKQAFTQFATPELTKLLNDTGLGSHPEVVRLFNSIGKNISESKLILGRMNATKSDAQILFGDSV